MTKNIITIDSGTTNTRVRLFHGRRHMATERSAVGVRDVAREGTKTPLLRGVHDCLQRLLETTGIDLEQVSVIGASGMLTSEVGLVTVPHVTAPASIHDLASHVRVEQIPEIGPLPIHFVPGVKTEPRDDERSSDKRLLNTDIMRGEEVESIGIMAASDCTGELQILLPGSHTKLVSIDSAGRIAASLTTMAGEALELFATKTILAKSVDWPPAGAPNWRAVEKGARYCRESGLLRSSFLVRLAQVIEQQTSLDCSWMLLGLTISEDLAELREWSRWSDDVRIIVGGREPLRSCYSHLLGMVTDREVETIDDELAELSSSLGVLQVLEHATCD